MAKELRRFFITANLTELDVSPSSKKSRLFLNLSESHHLRDVLHVKRGSRCVFFDRNGNEVIGQIDGFLHDGQAEIIPIAFIAPASELHVHLSVAQAIPQHRKMDEMVRMASEIGVFEIIPLVTERTVVRADQMKSQKMIDRWQRIALQTVKQSRWNRSPQIRTVTPLHELWKESEKYDRKILLHPDSNAESFGEYFKKNKSIQVSDPKILLVIGPEGGFSEEEVSEAKLNDVKILRLGSGILKTDTAFAVASGFLQLMYS